MTEQLITTGVPAKYAFCHLENPRRNENSLKRQTNLAIAELIDSPVHKRRVGRANNLVGVATPLRLVDAIDPVLGFDDDAAVLLHILGAGAAILLLVALLLRLLGLDRAVLAVASVDLQRSLVGDDVKADSGGVGGHGDGADHRVRGGVSGVAVGDPAGVVASAASTAQIFGLFNVLANQLGLSEVQCTTVGVADFKDLASGDLDAVCTDVASGQRHLESGVLQNVLFLEGIQVPVEVVSEHDRSLLGQSLGHNSRCQLRQTLGILRGDLVVDRESNSRNDVSWEVLEAFIKQGESDRGVRVRPNCPIARVVANEATVEGVLAVVLILGDVVGVAVDRERAVLDAVGIATHRRAKVGVVGLRVVQVLDRIIVAREDILDMAVAVIDQHRGQTRPVGNCLDGNALRRDGVAREAAILRAVGRRRRGGCLRQERQAGEGRREEGFEMHPEAEKSSDEEEHDTEDRQETGSKATEVAEPGSSIHFMRATGPFQTTINMDQCLNGLTLGGGVRDGNRGTVPGLDRSKGLPERDDVTVGPIDQSPLVKWAQDGNGNDLSPDSGVGDPNKHRG